MFEKLISNLQNFQKDLDKYLSSDDVLLLINDLKKEELFEGKRGDNSDITPNYEDRPEFAGWYLAFKKTLSTYRLNGTPDLYIDGTFHGSLFTIEIAPGLYQTDSDYSQAFMRDVVELHDNGTLLDLTERSTTIVASEVENWILTNFNVL